MCVGGRDGGLLPCHGLLWRATDGSGGFSPVSGPGGGRPARRTWAKSRHPTRQKSNPPTLGSAVQLQSCVRPITLFAPKIMVVCHNSSAATAPRFGGLCVYEGTP